MLLNHANSTGNYINDFSIISTVTCNISTIPQEISIPFLYTKRSLQSGTTSFSIPEPSQ